MNGLNQYKILLQLAGGCSIMYIAQISKSDVVESPISASFCTIRGHLGVDSQNYIVQGFRVVHIRTREYPCYSKFAQVVIL